MTLKIPKIIKPLNFAKKGLIFAKKYQIKDFPRLCNKLSNTEDTLEAKLNFSIENGNIACVEGDIKLTAVLVCQRCLDGVRLDLQPHFKLAFGQNEACAKGLDSNFELMLDTDETFLAVEFLTDEILVSLPMIPMHDFACASYETHSFTKAQKQENPFAILKTS